MNYYPFLKISELAKRESWRKEINRPIYHLHKWWAQRLGSVFRANVIHALGIAKDEWSDFYETHEPCDFTVYDPFMGSGTTLGEALVPSRFFRKFHDSLGMAIGLLLVV